MMLIIVIAILKLMITIIMLNKIVNEFIYFQSKCFSCFVCVCVGGGGVGWRGGEGLLICFQSSYN